MNIIEESDTECFDLLETLMPFLIMISFILGYLFLKVFKGNSSKVFFNNLKRKLTKNQENFKN